MSAPDFFGRTWNLQVQVKAANETWQLSNDGWDSEALRITFDIGQQATTAWWYADISIYNLAPGLHELIKKGDVVTLSAGYQSPGSNNRLIFKGEIYQPLWERNTAFDYRLTLHCLVGRLLEKNNEVSLTVPAQYNDDQAVRMVAEAAGINVTYLDPVLSDTKTKRERAEPFAGNPRIFFDLIAANHKINCWVDWNGLNVRPLAPLGEIPTRVYAPPLSPDSTIITQDGGSTRYTLIGAPQQTEQGVAFRTLIDSELTLGDLVKLDFSTVRQLAFGPFDQLKNLLFNKDGVFLAFAIRHLGDTRGNEWFTEVGAVTRVFSLLYGSQQL